MHITAGRRHHQPALAPRSSRATSRTALSSTRRGEGVRPPQLLGSPSKRQPRSWREQHLIPPDSRFSHFESANLDRQRAADPWYKRVRKCSHPQSAGASVPSGIICPLSPLSSPHLRRPGNPIQSGSRSYKRLN